MPTYCYVTKDGDRGEEFHAMGEAPVRTSVNGKMAERDFRSEACSPPPPGNYPKESMSCGVNPKHAAQAEAKLRALGCPTHYSRKTGNPTFRSKTHQNDFLKATGKRNNDAGYGDYAGK